MKIYTGIGSQSTPTEICDLMLGIAHELSRRDWKLRSGHAPGADMAFELGVMSKEIFLPWKGFNGSDGTEVSHLVPVFTEEIGKIARDYHPNWRACSKGARLLHMRNVCQVLGADCRTPSDMVVCWTPKGSGSGGTGQALRIAKAYGIPIFDLALMDAQQQLCEFIKERDVA